MGAQRKADYVDEAARKGYEEVKEVLDAVRQRLKRKEEEKKEEAEKKKKKVEEKKLREQQKKEAEEEEKEEMEKKRTMSEFISGDEFDALSQNELSNN